MIVRFAQEARDELREAVEWYAIRASKAAMRFMAAFEAAIDEITEFPEGPPR